MTTRKTELQQLRDLVLRMAALVEEGIQKSVQSLVERKDDLAREVIRDDHSVNAVDVQVDEESIKLIALMQPMASDLRFITTAMKIALDLERIGDYAVNVAERALELNEEPILKPYIDIPRMGEIAGGMVRDAIDAFVKEDKNLAMEVISRDDEVDDLCEAVFEELLSIMMRNPETVSRAVKITYVSKYLERIADHATNIAEVVVYLIEGKIIRHTDPTA
jgi:phosphate transport system protein